MTKKQKYYFSSFIAGIVLAILFGILALTASGGNSAAYTAAAATSGVAGIVGLILYFVNK